MFSDKEFLDISSDQALLELQKLLGPEKPPRRIEGYDISHQSGENAVGSMVVFVNGVADRSEYRKFKLRTSTNDDLKSMKEVITRRLKHAEWDYPDLILLDGGITQVNAILPIVEPLGIPVIGRDKSGNHSRNARVVLVVPDYFNRGDPEPGKARTSATTPVATGVVDAPRDWNNLEPSNLKSEYLELPGNSHIARLIARIDEEAHRFAITYHSLLKRKNMLK